MSWKTVETRQERLKRTAQEWFAKAASIPYYDTAPHEFLALLLEEVEDDVLDRAKRAIVRRAREGCKRLDFPKPISVTTMLLELDALGGKVFVRGTDE